MTALNSNPKSEGGILTLLLGPILLVSIALATANLLNTYKQIHHQKQESIWSIIQLDKEMGNTLFSAQKYINGYLDEKPLKMSYELLWSRFPITFNSMQKDKIFGQIDELTSLVNEVFSHVKSAELMILRSEKISKAKLNKWLDKLNIMDKAINQQLLQNIASSNSEYSQKTAHKILSTAAILLALVVSFILYLGYLLITLRKERSRNLHLLAHDTLTGLHSRDFAMRMIQSYCKDRIPFTLLTFDLNKFKAVNDTFGHHAGDQLLIHLAGKFKKTLSKFGTVGRIGGDEFLCIIKSDDLHLIQQQHALFLDELKDPCIVNGKRLLVQISTGGGIAADYGFHCTQLLERVDEAMYQAKALQIKEIFWENTATIETPPAVQNTLYSISRSTQRSETIE